MSEDVTPEEPLSEAAVKQANGFWISIIRTLAPKVAALIVTGLLAIGVELSNDAVLTVGALVYAALEALWYILARVLEEKVTNPTLNKIGGRMLLIPRSPDYGKTVNVTPAVTEG